MSYTISGSATNGVDPIDDLVEETIESVSLILQTPPLNVELPTYALGASTTMQNSAGVSIRDLYVRPLTRAERARLIRFGSPYLRRHVVVPRIVSPGPVDLSAPPPPPPTAWAVEVSTDLVNWEQIGTVEPTEEVDEFVDVDADNHESRFYRFSPVVTPAP